MEWTLTIIPSTNIFFRTSQSFGTCGGRRLLKQESCRDQIYFQGRRNFPPTLHNPSLIKKVLFHNHSEWPNWLTYWNRNLPIEWIQFSPQEYHIIWICTRGPCWLHPVNMSLYRICWNDYVCMPGFAKCCNVFSCQREHMKDSCLLGCDCWIVFFLLLQNKLLLAFQIDLRKGGERGWTGLQNSIKINVANM